jgi:sulfur relay (sulfurtransferase) DsrC/TusE family protein
VSISQALTSERFSELLKLLKVRLTVDHRNVLRFYGSGYEDMDADMAIRRLHRAAEERFNQRIGKRALCKLIDATAEKIVMQE